MNPIILIPARLASTRLPDKPLAMIGDAPMIVQVWRRAAKAGRAVVACDGAAIADVIAMAGGKAIITDPDLPSGSDRIHAALREIDPGRAYDVVVNVQGDMPTLDPAIIRKAVALLADPAVDIGTLAAPIIDVREKNDPAVVKVVMSYESLVTEKEMFALPMTYDQRPMTGRALDFSRNPIAAESGIMYHHIGIYAYRRGALEKFVALPPSAREQKEKLEQLRALDAGMRIEVGVVDTVPLGVDTPEILTRAREWYAKERI